jgi:hypothetical protein
MRSEGDSWGPNPAKRLSGDSVATSGRLVGGARLDGALGDSSVAGSF